jgi:hypothetical protein
MKKGKKSTEGKKYDELKYLLKLLPFTALPSGSRGLDPEGKA